MAKPPSGVIVLGVDPAYRTCGYCLVRTGKGGKVLAHGTIDAGSSRKDWTEHVFGVLRALREQLQPYPAPKVVGVEQINWYGKRKGVLALAHLAGAVAGYYAGLGASVLFFQPRDVKARSVKNGAPKGFDDHQQDALSLVKLAVEKVGRDHVRTPAPTT